MKKITFNWESKVEYILDTSGFSHVWNSQNSIHLGNIHNTFQKCLMTNLSRRGM